MAVEKERCSVNLFLQDGSIVKGFIYINPGERILDFFNDPREAFIPLTDVEISSSGSVRKNNFVILSKSSIKWIEEI